MSSKSYAYTRITNEAQHPLRHSINRIRLNNNLIPLADATYDVGENTTPLRWRNAYLSGLLTATGLYDADADTSVRVESTPDRDMIDFYEGGEHLMEADGGSIFFNPNRGDLDFIVGHRGTLYNTIWYNAGTQNLSFNAHTIFNQQYQNVDFTIRKSGAGDAYNYNAGTDVHTFSGQLLHLSGGDMMTEDDTPWYGGFDSNTDDGWIWHINTDIASAPWQGLTLRRVDGTATNPTVTDILMFFDLTNNVRFPTGDVYVNNTLDVNNLEADSLNVDGLTTLDGTTIDGTLHTTAPYPADFDWYIDANYGIRIYGNHFIKWYIDDVNTAKIRSTGGGDFTIGAVNENILFETGAVGGTDRLIIEADGDLIFNPSNNDDDFSIYKNTAGIAFVYDAGDDTTSIGDGGTTNYTQFAADGGITLHGTARVIKCLNIEPKWTQGHGANPPQETTEDNANYFFVTHDYDDTVEESTYYSFQTNHDYAAAGAMELHFDFFVDTAPAAAKSVTFGVEYKKVTAGTDAFSFAAATSTAWAQTSITTGTPANDKLIHQTGATSLTTTGWLPNDIVLMRFFRDATGALGTDDFVGDVRVFNYHLEYLSDVIGEDT